MMEKANIAHPSLICVDAGTTNTRVWLLEGDRVLAKAQAVVGVRDTARDGSPAQLHQALCELIARVRAECADVSPSCVIAAGMITSPLGLEDVPHVPAPAGLDELAASIVRRSFPQITGLPVLLVPGVRCGTVPCDRETVTEADVMRGEETLCMGLIAQRTLAPNATLLNLGSHWKVICLDASARIASSITSMSGELIHTTQTQTILAESVPHQRPSALSSLWLKAGMREQRRSGLARALFIVRLLAQRSEAGPEDRLAFLIGAYLASDFDALVARRALHPDSAVTITGGGAVAEAWQSALGEVGIPAKMLNEREVESAMLEGARRLAEKAGN